MVTERDDRVTLTLDVWTQRDAEAAPEPKEIRGRVYTRSGWVTDADWLKRFVAELQANKQNDTVYVDVDGTRFEAVQVRDIARVSWLDLSPSVLNPEAVGDPNATPIVALPPEVATVIAKQITRKKSK